MTRAELLARISVAEFREWMVYERLEPFGDRRADLHCGIVASVLANLMGRREGDPPYVPSEFMPQWEEPERRDPGEDQQRKLALLVSLFDGQRLSNPENPVHVAR